MKLREAKNIHCVGAGGIGLSAVAKFLVAQGKRVSGSDLQETEVTRELAAHGVAMAYPQLGDLPKKTELVIYSEAAQFDNPDRVVAREKNIPEMSYAEALGAISRDKRTIAVSGSNGKSTTTAMIGLILEAAGFDPTVIVGSRVPGFPMGNIRIGESDWMVVEADDYHAHLLHLRPEIAVLTNIEEEHMDYFTDIGHITRTFQSFIDSLPEDGSLIVNADDPVSFEDLMHHPHTVSYGIDEPADYQAINIRVGEGKQTFEVKRTTVLEEEPFGEMNLKVPGRFNISNAMAAVTCALSLGVPAETVKEVFENFKGIWRRFELLGHNGKALVVSDYGHHPSAIRATVAAAREFYPDRRLVLVYQPHQRHRTKALLSGFAEAFDNVDLLILSDIYDVAGREDAADSEVTSNLIVEALAKRKGGPRVIPGGDLRRTEELVRSNIEPNDLILVMGAGSIDSLARNLVRNS